VIVILKITLYHNIIILLIFKEILIRKHLWITH